MRRSADGMIADTKRQGGWDWSIEWRPGAAPLLGGFVETPGDDPAARGAPGDAADLYRDDDLWLFVAGYVFDADRAGLARALADRYRRLGDALVDELRGGFVLVVWTRERDELRVFRDATGLQTCFYNWNGTRLRLACAVDSLLRHADVDVAVNHALAAEYVYGVIGAHQREETFYSAVCRLLPAHRLLVGSRGVSTSRYWDPLPDGFDWFEGDADARTEALLTQAVDRCLSAGADSIGLSGGFDSVSIALLAARTTPSRPLHALSILMTDSPNDESPLQRGVADTLGMPLHAEPLPAIYDRHDFCERALMLSGDLPSPVMSAWQWLMDSLLREAAKAGCRGVLLGTGGDEMFGVDPRYAEDLFDRGQWRDLGRFVRAWSDTSPVTARRIYHEILWRALFRRKLVRGTRAAIPQRLRTVLARARDALDWRQLSPPAEMAALLRRRAATTASETPRDSTPYREAVRDLMHSPYLLMELDQALASGRRFGVTFMYPFFDRDLVEHALRIHPMALYAKGRMKAPLREIVARRLELLSLPKRKVDFTDFGNALFRRSGPAAWKAYGAGDHLQDAGIVEPARAEAWLRGFFAGDRHSGVAAWRLLSMQAWLQSRR